MALEREQKQIDTRAAMVESDLRSIMETVMYITTVGSGHIRVPLPRGKLNVFCPPYCRVIFNRDED
ncbi:hypothetical protein scyTo_0024682, partial [Scyliorhinus torazame]|nr:hypothetical protein [Scyliorhinus torazame]